MANEIFRAISNLRLVLDTETDADSPDNETTYKAVREMIEILYQILLSTGDSGSATEDPPDDTTGVLTDSAGGYSVDEHNGRTLVITSGLAKGSFYTIDDTTATTLVCTDDNLYSDGVRSGDDYVVLYDIKVNTTGHDHDGINSANVVLADGSISEAKYGAGSVDQTALKTSQGEVSTSATSANLTLPGGEYGFYPQTKVQSSYDLTTYISGNLTNTAYSTNIYLLLNTGGVSGYAQQRYVTASGEIHWIFIQMEAGKIINVWQAPDHPTFGNRGMVHPFPDFDPGKQEIIVVNPSLIEVEQVLAACIPKIGGGFFDPDDQDSEEDYLAPERSFIDTFFEYFEIDETNESIWPDTEITIALPKIHQGKIVSDWRFMPQYVLNPETGLVEPLKINPVKRVIPKPDFITPLKIRRK